MSRWIDLAEQWLATFPVAAVGPDPLRRAPLCAAAVDPLYLQLRRGSDQLTAEPRPPAVRTAGGTA